MSLMSIFIAGPSRDLDRCERAVFAVRRFALVSEAWTEKVREDRDAGLTDIDLSEALALQRANECVAGVMSADVVLWLSGGSEGAALEAGVCIANRIPFVIAGTPHPLYRSKALACLPTDRDAIAFLADYSIRWARRAS